MDVEGIEAGENFDKVIEASIGSSDTVVVVIGRQWAGINDRSGTKRIDDPSDYVRQEIATSLRLNVELVPVLVGGARFPSQNDLPAELREMAFRNALQIEDDAFLAGMDRLIAVLERTTAASMERKRLTRSTREKKEGGTGDSRFAKNLRTFFLFYAPAHRATWILHVVFYYLLFSAIVASAAMAFDSEVGIGMVLTMLGSFAVILALLRAIATIVEPDHTTSDIRRWWLLYRPPRARTALLHALFFLMVIFGSTFVFVAVAVVETSALRVLVAWVIATLLLREIASRRDPLRKKDAEPDWFSRTLYLGQHSWSSTWLPRILFYASGLMFVMLLPEIFAADDGKLQWPWVSIDRAALIRTTFCLALAICARGWVKSSEVLRHVHSSHNSIRRAAMLYLPSRRVEWVPQLFFWVALAVLLGLVLRGSLTISLFGLATRTGWIELSAFAAVLAFSAQRWSRLYVQHAESELQPASSLASTYTSTRPSVRQPEDPSRDDPSAEVSGVDARWQRS